MHHKIAGLSAALILAVTAGCDNAREKESPAPTVLRVVCDDEGTTAVATRVRAIRDGVHISFDNRSGARQYYIRTASDEGQNHGGGLRGRLTEVRTTMPPGALLVACFQSGDEYPYAITDFAEVRVVDPDGLWTPPNLDCDREEEAGRFVDGKAVGYAPKDVEGMIRAQVPGIEADDEIVNPGYPQTEWHSEFRLVVRAGKAVASVSVARQDNNWQVDVRRCPGIEIG
ncbi:MAG: hypothetical protein ACRDJV_12940 [Actinomycetota bacterium]